MRVTDSTDTIDLSYHTINPLESFVQDSLSITNIQICTELSDSPERTASLQQIENWTNQHSKVESTVKFSLIDLPKYALVEPFCRICYDNEIETDGKLEKPVYACRCRGTVGLVHLSCLQKWLTISQTARCELCHYQFPTKQILRYGKLRSVQVWFSNIVDRSQLFFDISAWLIMTPIIMTEIKENVDKINLHFEHTSMENWSTNEISDLQSVEYVNMVGSGLLATIVATGYLLWIIYTLRHYIRSWKSFYKSNANITVVLLTQVNDECSYT